MNHGVIGESAACRCEEAERRSNPHPVVRAHLDRDCFAAVLLAMTVERDRRLLRAYRLTRYSAAGFDIFIGRRVPDALFERLGARSATLVTAWNPLSRRRPEGWNRRMQLRLCERLRRVVTVSADGALGRWHEAHVLVAGDHHRAARLARLYRQLGIVVVRRGRRTRLMVRGERQQSGFTSGPQ